MTDRRLSPAFEIKRAAIDDAGTFEGIASSFYGVDSYGDTCVPGCYKRTLERHKAAGTRPALLFAHDQSQPIGVWLDMREDSLGLRVKGKLTLETAKGAEAHALMRDGALGLSIGYAVLDAEPGAKAGQRILKAIELYEISAVALPADSGAKILGIKFQNIREFEAAAQDVLGLSQREAKRLSAGGFNALMRRDDRSDELTELARAIATKADELKFLLTKGPR